ARNTKSKSFALLLKEFDTILSLDIDLEKKVNISDNIQNILNERQIARDNKDFSLSDKLRDKLNELGYKVIDSSDGQKIEEI
ncbi:MAG: hypothetical protein RSC92_04845, partial [Clostridia bacterium]